MFTRYCRTPAAARLAISWGLDSQFSRLAISWGLHSQFSNAILAVVFCISRKVIKSRRRESLKVVVLETFVAPGLVSLARANTSADMDHNGLGRQMVARTAERLTFLTQEDTKMACITHVCLPPSKNICIFVLKYVMCIISASHRRWIMIRSTATHLCSRMAHTRRSRKHNQSVGLRPP